MRTGARDVAAFAVLALAGSVGASAHWGWARAGRAGIGGGPVILVTSTQDIGLGSLRQAIFDANRAQERARIEIRARHIQVHSPLPPLVNPSGITVDGRQEAEIEASGLEGDPLFDVASPLATITGLTLSNPGGPALRIQRGSALIVNVRVHGSRVGVQVGELAHDSMIEQSRFEANETGILIEAGAELNVQHSVFAGNRIAGIWAAAPSGLAVVASQLAIEGNEFTSGRYGAVLVGGRARLSGNRFAGCSETAVFVSGHGVVVRGNRVFSGAVGILATETEGLVLEDNEIDHNTSIGLLLRGSIGALVRGNRMDANGYGIAVIFDRRELPSVLEGNLLQGQKVDGLFILGGSPTLRTNEVVASGGAGLRLLTYLAPGREPIAARPVLKGNTLRGNAHDEPVEGEYRPVPPRRPGEAS